MAIITAANFDYKGPLANFERDSYATLADMVSVNENYLPNVFIGVCEETGKAYLYNKSNTVDPTLGKWREIVGGTDITDYIRKSDDFSTLEPMYDGEIVQYIGETTENYIQGYFYKCISDGAEPATYSWEQIDVQPATDLIWGNIEGDITNQEDLNTELTSLQDQIDSLSGRGRYLTLWNCSTGLAETNPPESPYTYKTGDYFIVGTVAASGETNYRPDGTSYTTGVASEVEEIEEVSVDDTYIFDGTTWHLQYNSQKTVTFTNIEGSPYDNTNLADALNSKVSKVEDASIVYGTDENGEQTTYDMTAFGQIDNVAVHGVDQTITDKRVDLSVVEQYDETTMPAASEDLLGRVIQYIGQDTNTLTHDYFYECVEVTNTDFTIWTDNEGTLSYFYKPQYYNKETFENYVHPTESTTITLCCKIVSEDPWEVMWYLEDDPNPDNPTEARPSWYGWEYTPDDLDRTTGANSSDKIKFIYTTNTTYEWVRKDVQPNTAIWGSITGTLSNQTDLQSALDSKQNVLTPGNNITIEEDSQTGDLVISSTAYESFFRGRWNDWNSVPSDTQYYPEDFHNNRVPEKNDYIVLDDASGYIGTDVNYMTVTNAHDHVEYSYYDVETQSTTTGSISNGVFGKNEELRVVYTGYSNVKIYANKDGVIYNNVSYNKDEQIVQESWTGSSTWTFYFPSDTLVGSWRFRYTGEWTTDGKNGWKPEYQLENVLPIATDQEPGITKIYSTTGQNTDGTMTQKSISDALSNIKESFYRGRFNSWNSVPVNESGYLPEPGTQDLKTPTNNDFIVIIDPSDYASPEFTEDFTFSTFNDPELGYGVSWTYLNVTYKVYGNTVVFGPGDCLQLLLPQGGLTARRTTIVDGTPLYPNSGVRWIGGSSHTASTTGSPGDYTGTWRFYYNGDWATDGKLGWFPQYQIENTLPIASPTEQGITKLYNTTGTNTDGAVDQNTVTSELGKKQDTLTEGSGISIDENNVISATFSESYFRGKFSTWDTVPTDYRNYYPDYTGSTKPTRTDYMVVEDPSSYVKPGDPIYIYQLPWQQPFAYVRIVFGATDVTLNHQQTHENPPIIGTVGNQMRVEYDNYQWKIIPLDIPVIVDGVEKPINEVAYSWSYNSGSSEYLQKELNFKGTGGYVGTWRFSYQSDNWDATGKNGWYPEYQIEDILPIATDTDAGIMKLYTTTGSNTDGTMDQSSITIELGNKQDLLTNASNAGEGIIIDDVTQEISTNNIVWRKW